MPCYAPIRAWRAPGLTASGRLSVTFNQRRGYADTAFKIPCGQCIGCRLERSRQWALRCMHEAALYQKNCFLTLTYSDENLPALNSLKFRDFQLFIKKLRKKYGSHIRFFHCGEYGEKTNRPHYHALIFNFDFDDKQLHAVQKDGHRLYTSKSLEKLWPLGYAVIGSVTFESAAYVARYCVKKITGREAEDAYLVVDNLTGELLGSRRPPYATMSRRPGIGMSWYEKYKAEVYPSDFVIRDAVPMRPPKAYDRKLEQTDPKMLVRVRARRIRNASQHAADNTPDRLRVRETVKLAQVAVLKRGLDE